MPPVEYLETLLGRTIIKLEHARRAQRCGPAIGKLLPVLIEQERHGDLRAEGWVPASHVEWWKLSAAALIFTVNAAC